MAASGSVVGPNGGLVTISAAAYTLSAETNNLTLNFTSASAVAFTINPGLPVGFSCTVIQGGAGQITFTAASGVTLLNLSSVFTSGGQYAAMLLTEIAQDVFVLSGGVSGALAGGITQLTGAVTAGPGSGSQAATIPAASITYAKIQNVAASSLVGNPTGAPAVAEGVTLGANLTFNGAAIDVGDAPLVLTGQTLQTSGTSTGTLTNLPVAGNPTVLLVLSVNGTSYCFPGWPL